MAKVIEVTACIICPYKNQYNNCGNPEAREHGDCHKQLPAEGIADFCCLQDKDDYVESEFDIDMEPGDIPDYVPESGDRVYTKKDFIEIAKGNKQYAKFLRSRCTWQHPETLVEEDLREGEIVEFDGTYLLTGGNDEEFEYDNPKEGKTMPPPFRFSEMAEAEGWGIFYTGINDGVHNLYELQRLDMEEFFPDDKTAITHVVVMAINKPKGIHAEALLYLARYSPNEIDSIVRKAVGDETFAELKEVMRYTEFDKF